MYEGIYNLKNGVSEGTKYSQLPHVQSSLLNDGSSIFWSTFEDGHISVYYDVNGNSGPNKWAEDLFNFNLMNGIVYPCGDPAHDGIFESRCAVEGSDGRGCTAWVIYKGKLDYLKCNNLTWEKQKCD